MEEIIEQHALWNLKVVLIYILVTILLLCIAFVFKKHQRNILWVAGIAMFAFTLLGIIFGNLVPKVTHDLLAITIGIISPGLYIWYAERLHAKL